jgi:ferredoxin
MPKITFLPQQISIDVEPQTKILAAANKLKVGLRFGCGAARCGTCGVKIKGTVAPKNSQESQLLTRLKLNDDETIRLACQTRVLESDIEVDLGFQDEYSSDIGFED